MRNEHYSLTLEVPSHKEPRTSEVRTFRIITSDRISETRADVFSGRLVVVEGMQWFIRLDDSPILGQDGLVAVLRTQHRPRIEYTTGNYDSHASRILYPDSPYALRVINALYLYGDITAATKALMVKSARDSWQLHMSKREKAAAFETVKSYLQTGDVTAKQLRSLAEQARREEVAYKAELKAAELAHPSGSSEGSSAPLSFDLSGLQE